MTAVAVIFMIVLFLIGVPIAFTLGVLGLFTIGLSGRSLEVVPLMVFDGSLSYTLIAIPLFILLRQIMSLSSISTRLIDFASSLVGFIRGGLGMTTVFTGMGMASISGSSVADAAALGSILIPEMDKRGYGKNFSTSIVSASATIAQIIPPSITMILYAVIAGVSVSELFIAGIIPGIIIGIGLMVVIYWYALSNNLQVYARFNWKSLRNSFRRAIFGLILPVIVIGGILGGFFTPTEAGAIGVLYSVLLTIFYGEFTILNLIKALTLSAKQTSIVVIMVGTSALLGYFLARQRIPQEVAELILNFSTNKYIVLFLVSALLLIGGMFLHGTPLIIMLIPIVAPLVQSVDVNLVQFGVIACICIAIGQITPPVASVLIVTSSIAEINIGGSLLRSLTPMLIVFLIVLCIVAVFPMISLWLPKVLY